MTDADVQVLAFMVVVGVLALIAIAVAAWVVVEWLREIAKPLAYFAERDRLELEQRLDRLEGELGE